MATYLVVFFENGSVDSDGDVGKGMMVTYAF